MKYKDTGVDIDAAQDALKGVRAAIAGTWGPQVASDVGSFGGLFRLDDGSFLVSSIDGVGTKLMVALQAEQVDGVGADLLNHCVNDILVQGARPLFFLDYYAAGRLSPDHFKRVIGGMAAAARDNGCALIGGETAEMPGMYREDDFDLAGCIVGQVSAERLITGQEIREGMVVYGWRSSGLHTNGYSLARRALLEGPNALDLSVDPGSLGCTLADALLAVHRSYLAPVEQLREHATIAGLCHLTGGGFYDNIPRVLPAGLGVIIDASAWEVPPIFRLIQERGNVDLDEMRRVFNLGIGMLAVCDEVAPAHLDALGERPIKLGRVVAAEGPLVRFES